MLYSPHHSKNFDLGDLYFFSCSCRLLLAKAIGLIEPSSWPWAKTAPRPDPEASVSNKNDRLKSGNANMGAEINSLFNSSKVSWHWEVHIKSVSFLVREHRGPEKIQMHAFFMHRAPWNDATTLTMYTMRMYLLIHVYNCTLNSMCMKQSLHSINTS